MIIPEKIEQLLALTHTFGWLTGVTDQLVCHTCRTCGVSNIENDQITILIMPSLSEPLINTIQKQPKISFTFINVQTFESYQLKGKYLECMALSAEDERTKGAYMNGMKEALQNIGFKYGDSFKKYAELAGVAVRMKVEEIFDQTPRPGSGSKLKENRS